MQADRQCTLELDALPSRIQQVRRIVSAQLRYWHLDPLLDTALLGITELLANVHRHAGADKHCAVELTLVSGRLTVSVLDSDPHLPQVRPSEPMATCGRGLAMVAALSDSWGADPVPGGGKIVWFSLHVEAPAPAPRRRPARRAPAVAVA
ncbi:ATP-binding protein [Streptomyces sp. H10-C2]|uniref:ATP-binding protein n=1 Tax=unclassified Streptomyces TaxID=2593676 RepID=UPI0024B920C0|nr:MULTISPECIES: ATP-binding protein [unclassified Streptomyces]MDJ0342892.1 ATP-binding protein [Streptomyces sp. PH10-H1]MDJ0372665.1 ATP-binding protein [Streptomyces sp. H10-C2]